MIRFSIGELLKTRMENTAAIFKAVIKLLILSHLSLVIKMYTWESNLMLALILTAVVDFLKEQA